MYHGINAARSSFVASCTSLRICGKIVRVLRTHDEMPRHNGYLIRSCAVDAKALPLNGLMLASAPVDEVGERTLERSTASKPSLLILWASLPPAATCTFHKNCSRSQ